MRPPFLFDPFMRHTRYFAAALFGLSLLASSHGLAAQEKKDSAAKAAREAAEVQGWFGEIEQLHGRLQDIQEQALQDPQINAAQTGLGNLIKQAMEKSDPALVKGFARMQAMETEAAAAQQKGDTGKLQQLGAEAQQIEKQFAAAQQKVLQQPEIASRVAAFQQALERKMLSINPDTEKLIARFQELETKLAASAQAAGAPR